MQNFRIARIYIVIVFLLSVLVILGVSSAFVNEPSLILTAAVVAAVIAFLDLYPVILRHQVEVTISTAVKIAAVILAPVPVLLLAIFFGTLIAEWRLKRVWYKQLFNVGVMTLTYTFAAFIYRILHQSDIGLLASVQNLLSLALLGVSELVINSVLISLVIALTAKLPITYVWAENFKPIVLHDLSMLPLGVLIAMLWQSTPWSVILMAAPLMAVRHSYQLVTDLQRQTREALMALARVLDERDEHTSQHSELVSQCAGMIAHELGLGPGQVDVITRAAWLHDIGKVGMRNDILFKPGPLTPAERETAKRHAALGGDLLEKFPLFETGAIYVRHHHERWDGKGYPDGLSGEAIPLGARILTVADSYQAMVEERPYRKPLSDELALEQLRQAAGTQFDPKVVEALFRAKGFTMTSSVTDDSQRYHNQVSPA